MDGWNTTFLLGRPIFRGYVSFREGIIHAYDGLMLFSSVNENYFTKRNKTHNFYRKALPCSEGMGGALSYHWLPKVFLMRIYKGNS